MKFQRVEKTVLPLGEQLQLMEMSFFHLNQHQQHSLMDVRAKVQYVMTESISTTMIRMLTKHVNSKLLSTVRLTDLSLLIEQVKFSMKKEYSWTVKLLVTLKQEHVKMEKYLDETHLNIRAVILHDENVVMQ